MTAEQARAAWADVDSEITKYNARCGRTFILPTEEGAYDACIADKGLPAGITHLVVEGQDTGRLVIEDGVLPCVWVHSLGEVRTSRSLQCTGSCVACSEKSP